MSRTLNRWKKTDNPKTSPWSKATEHRVTACEVVIERIVAIGILPEKIEVAAHEVGVQSSGMKKKLHFIITSLNINNKHILT